MEQSSHKDEIRAELLGRDLLSLKILSSGKKQVHFIGCEEFSQKILELKKKFGSDPAQWEIPKENSHSGLLIKEFILKCRGQWKLVLDAHELCHCRSISTQAVEQSILAGAHTAEQVSRLTSASTACGTCRPHVEEILQERLK